jgi:CHAT domain-containing protein
MLHKLCQSMAFNTIEPGQRTSDVISHLPQCKIFHFAGHGFTHGSDPSKSYLLLSDGRNNPLKVAALLEMNIREQLPFLAYLSACRTGQSSDERLLDESIHLISAFQLAGFRHVIGTLWEVNDEVYIDVARITYEGIRDGRMTDESVCLGLHNATRKLRNDWLFAKGSRHRLKIQFGPRDAGHGD